MLRHRAPQATPAHDTQPNAPAISIPVVHDPAMVSLYENIAYLATLPPCANILILGETGVGKEELTKTIHRLSRRSQGPFVAVNCPAIPESLIERELFGHVRGAFTDAKTGEPGYFEQANGGTILLDEIGELSLAMQVKLLRVVEERRVRRLGDSHSRPFDARIIAATNQNLEERVAHGTFRQDLYYRLSAIEINVPPLRMRPGDIVPLAEHLLDHVGREFGLSGQTQLSAEAMACLRRYEYPGNVRELRCAMLSALVQSRGNTIRPEHLPPRMTARNNTRMQHEHNDQRVRRRAADRERILWALGQTGGNQTRAARLIDMPLRTFVTRLDEMGIARPKKDNPAPAPHTHRMQ